MDFKKDSLGHIKLIIDGNEYFIHQTIVNWIFVCLFVLLLFIVLGLVMRFSNPKKPNPVAVLVENLYIGIEGLVVSNAGKRNSMFIPYVGTLAIIMFLCNILGLIGLQPPTSNLGLNAVLAILSFIFIHTWGIKTHGLKYFKKFFEPIFILFPVNVIGELATPVSLSVRLFANIFSGLILMSLVYTVWLALLEFSLFLAPISLAINFISVGLHGFFDIFVGFLQTYVFFTLTMYFIGEASSKEAEA